MDSYLFILKPTTKNIPQSTLDPGHSIGYFVVYNIGLSLGTSLTDSSP